jgi:hypothetical protein
MFSNGSTKPLSQCLQTLTDPAVTATLAFQPRERVPMSEVMLVPPKFSGYNGQVIAVHQAVAIDIGCRIQAGISDSEGL